MRKDTYLAAVYDQRAALLRRVATLADSHWEDVCPAPDPPQDVVRLDTPRRTVREVVAHLLVVDGSVLGTGAVRAPRQLGQPGAWDLRRVGPLAERPPAELVSMLARRGERFGRLVSAAPAAAYRVPVPGPFGRLPLGQMIGRRVLHEWLHEQDIAAAASAAQPPERPWSTAVGRVLGDTVLQLLPAVALPRVAREHGVLRLVVDLGGQDDPGGSQRAIWGIDFSRRQYGPRVLRPADATIRVDAGVLALLALGRADRLGTRPCVAVDGDEALAESLLDVLGSRLAPAPCVETTQRAAAS